MYVNMLNASLVSHWTWSGFVRQHRDFGHWLAQITAAVLHTSISCGCCTLVTM